MMENDRVIITVFFPGADGNTDYEKLFKAQQKSIQIQYGDSIIYRAVTAKKPEPGPNQHYRNNNHKLVLWSRILSDYILNDTLLFDVLLLDADVIVTGDILEPFDNQESAWHVGITKRSRMYPPINGGVLYLRKGNESLLYFRKMCEEDILMQNETTYHDKWKQRYPGMNQSAMGAAMEKLEGLINIEMLPCSLYNACSEDWPYTIENEARSIHVKEQLRDAVFGRLPYLQEWKPSLDLLQNYMETAHLKSGRKRWDEILNRLPEGNATVIEVGVWHGKNALHLLHGNESVHLTMIDTWEPPEKDSSYYKSGSKIAVKSRKEFEQAYISATNVMRRFPERTRILAMTSQEACDLIPDNSVDLVFIDADHSYESVMKDISCWLPKVKPGGYLCGHDYGHPYQGNVKQAVDRYFGPSRIEIAGDYTWFFHKTTKERL